MAEANVQSAEMLLKKLLPSILNTIECSGILNKRLEAQELFDQLVKIEAVFKNAGKEEPK